VEEAMRLCPEPLDTLQAECHPYLDQTKVLAACRRLGLVFTAYCPLAHGRLFSDPVLGEIARERGKTIAQIALRWLMQQGNIAAIPRSANPKHMAESLQVFDFELTAAEMSRISALKRPDGRIADPKGRAPAWD
jgi:2,5-diketo-D-gluconate reductase B